MISQHLAEDLMIEMSEEIRAALKQCDGSNASVVAMMTGFSREVLIDLGGVPEDD